MSEGFLDKVKRFFSFSDEYRLPESSMDESAVHVTEVHRGVTEGARPNAAKRQAEQMEIVIFNPLTDEESLTNEIGTALKAGKCVIVNFSSCKERNTCRRVVDFAGGMVYMVDGSYSKISDNIYLFSPKNVTIVKPSTPNDDYASVGGEVIVSGQYQAAGDYQGRAEYQARGDYQGRGDYPRANVPAGAPQPAATGRAYQGRGGYQGYRQ